MVYDWSSWNKHLALEGNHNFGTIHFKLSDGVNFVIALNGVLQPLLHNGIKRQAQA